MEEQPGQNMTHSGQIYEQIHFDILNVDKTSRVEGEDQGYKLHFGGYNGTAGDSLANSNGMKFSTRDRDNDKYWRNCAKGNEGGWWFNE